MNDENMAYLPLAMMGMPAVACYICEMGYQPLLRRRRCTGDPA